MAKLRGGGSAGEAERGAADAVGKAQRSSQAAVVTKDQARAATLQSVSSIAMAPTMIELGGMFGGGALGFLGLNKAASFMKVVFAAPVEALRATALGDLMHLPANWFKAVAKHAPGMGARGERWAEAAQNKAARFEQLASARDAAAAKRTGDLFASVGKTLDGAQNTGAGGALHGFLSDVVQGRATAAGGRHAKALGAATEAATREGAGFFKRIGHFVMRTKPALVEAGALAPALSQLQMANALQGAQKAEHLGKLVSTLETQVAANAFSGEALHRANAVMKHATKAMKSAQAMDMFAKAGGSAKTMLGVFAKAATRIPVFNAMVMVGVGTGVMALGLRARGESKQAKAAFNDLLADIGEAGRDSDFAKAVKMAHRSQNGWATAKAGLETVGQVADGMMWLAPGGVGAAVITAQMLPVALSALVSDNPLLAAYKGLQQHEAGTLKFEHPSQQLGLVKQLVAAMPAASVHKGMGNALVTQSATEMLERKMSVKQMVQLLSNDTQFTQFLAEVSAKNEAQAAIAKAQHSAKATPVEVVGAPKMEVPSTRITADAREHKGMMHARERAIA